MSYTDIDEVQKMLEDIRRQTSVTNKLFSLTTTADLGIPEDTTLLEAKYENICNDLQTLRNDTEERIRIIEKTEYIMNILNYKMYEIRYNFTTTIEELKANKDDYEGDVNEKNENQVAQRLVEIDNQMLECEHLFELKLQSVRQQKLEVQKEYENTINVLDNNLDILRKNCDNLVLLIEAEKANAVDSEVIEVKYMGVVEELHNEIEKFRELQATGWKKRYTDEEFTADLEAKGLKITNSGLLVTNTGHILTYEEALELRLLDNIELSFDYYKGSGEKKKSEFDGDRDSRESNADESTKSSDYSRMTSEDVLYLKENLGTPLTLALAEITAVQPRDPIHYLGHWLFKYRYNQEVAEIQRIEVEQLNDERERIAKEKWHKFIEEEARAAVLEMIYRAEEIAIQHELERIQREFEEMEEETIEKSQLDDEARDKFATYD